MKRNLFILSLLALLLFSALPLMAQQDVISTNTPEDLSVVPVELEAVATAEATTAPVPDTPVVVNIEQPANPAPAPATPPFDWDNLIMGILAAVIMFDRYTNGSVVKTLAQIFKISDEHAKSIYEDGIRAGIEREANRAAKTPDPEDDKRVAKVAADAGYELVTLSDGRIVLAKIVATAPTIGGTGSGGGGAIVGDMRVPVTETTA